MKTLIVLVVFTFYKSISPNGNTNCIAKRGASSNNTSSFLALPNKELVLQRLKVLSILEMPNCSSMQLG